MYRRSSATLCSHCLHDLTFLWPGGCRYDHVMNTNLKSVYRFCQMAHPLLKVSAGSTLDLPSPLK